MSKFQFGGPIGKIQRLNKIELEAFSLEAITALFHVLEEMSDALGAEHAKARAERSLSWFPPRNKRIAVELLMEYSRANKAAKNPN